MHMNVNLPNGRSEEQEISEYLNMLRRTHVGLLWGNKYVFALSVYFFGNSLS